MRRYSKDRYATFLPSRIAGDFRRFSNGETGTVAIEFAGVLLVLFLIIMPGFYDVYRAAAISDRVSNAANLAAEQLARNRVLDLCDLMHTIGASQKILDGGGTISTNTDCAAIDLSASRPASRGDYAIILTSIRPGDGGGRGVVETQFARTSGISRDDCETLVDTGGSLQPASDFTLSNLTTSVENLVSVELCYRPPSNYFIYGSASRALFADAFYRRAVMRTRHGLLTELMTTP